MIKQQIQRQLQHKKLTSTSDLVLFIIQQVTKISYLDPIEQLMLRVNELQKPKGLDNIMLQEVKTIVEAVVEHREEGIMEGVESIIDDKLTRMNEMIDQKIDQKIDEKIQVKVQQLFDQYMAEREQQQNMLKNQRPTCLRQVNSLQFTNTDSLSLDNFYKPRTISEEPYSKNNFNSTTALNFNNFNSTTGFTSKSLSNRNSFKKTNPQSLSPSQQNQNLLSTKLLSDSKTLRKSYHTLQLTQNPHNHSNQTHNKLKQTLNSHNKQIQDLKHSIIQLQRSLTDKLNLQEIHQIMSQFETQICQNIHSDKIHLQNIQFTLKKQLQSQILNFKKQTFNQLNSHQQQQKFVNQINKEILALKKSQQKRTSKYQKLKGSVKQLSQQQKNINSSQLLLEKSIKSQKVQLQKYEQFNNSKNEDLGCLLQKINEKIQYFDRVEQIEHNFTLIKSNIAAAQYQTQFRVKNDQLVWQREVFNIDSRLFRFQTQKSQIIINEKGVYQVEFILRGSKTIEEFLGTLQILPAGMNFNNFNNFNKREFKVLSSQNLLRYFVEVQQKSLISLRISNCENQTLSRSDLTGLIKVSKF